MLPYLLLTPALILLVGMVYRSAWGCITVSRIIGCSIPKQFRFIWFDNYLSLINEPLFSRALEFTLGFTVVAVVVQVGLGLAVALFLHARIPGRKVMRALMLLPLMMPPVITALMWKIMMASTNAGILNHMLSFIGVDPVNWFGSTRGAMVSILIIDTWGNLPFVSLILLGGFAGIAHRTVRGGPGRWRKSGGHAALYHVAAAGPFIVLAVTFRTMDSLRIFDVIYATTMGGPNDATTNLHIMALPICVPMVPDGQRHGAGDRAAVAGRRRQRGAAAAVESGGGEHGAMTAGPRVVNA